MSWLSNALGTSRPNAPTLPTAPTLVAPQLPQYPGLTSQQQALLQQMQGYLTSGQGALTNYQNNPYLQQSQQASQQALTNYQNALQGNIPPNQMLEQQKQEAWNQMVQNAAQQGIRISGNSPSSAVSQSTAGNQQIADFNKTWGALEQNYNLGQQQIGLQAQQSGNQQANQQFQNVAQGYGNLGTQAGQLYQPYTQQQLGPWQVATQQATTNADIQNQNAMNAYQQQLQQLGLNYNNALSGYQNSMGLAGGIGSLAGTIGGSLIGNSIAPGFGSLIGAQIGGQAGSLLGGGQTQGGNNGMMGNMGSFIQAYRQPSNTGSMGFQPYQQGGTQGPYAYGRAS